MDEILTYNREDLAATWAVFKWLKTFVNPNSKLAVDNCCAEPTKRNPVKFDEPKIIKSEIATIRESSGSYMRWPSRPGSKDAGMVEPMRLGERL